MSPAIQRSSVDLPDPDLPRRATISPSCNSRSIPSSTGRFPPEGVSKSFLRLHTEMITLDVVVTDAIFSSYSE